MIAEENREILYEVVDISQNIGELYSSDVMMSVYGDNIYMCVDNQELFMVDKDGKNRKQILNYEKEMKAIKAFYVLNEKQLFLLVEKHTDSDKRFVVEQLDAEGKIGEEIDLHIEADKYIDNFVVDDENIYFTIDGENIVVLDFKGEKKCEISGSTGKLSMCRGNDGNIYVGEVEDEILTIYIIDLSANKLDKRTVVNVFEDGSGVGFFSGTGYAFCFYDENYLYGYVSEKKLTDGIMNWVNTDIEGSQIKQIEMLTDGGIIIQLKDTEESFSLVRLDAVDEGRKKDRELLVMAGINIDPVIREKIITFNKENERYRILVKDYVDKEDSYAAMNIDIVAGEQIDIICLQGLPVEQYIEKGILEDLSGYMKDGSLKKSDFSEAYLETVTQEGKIYQMAPAFTIYTIFGREEEVGEEMGWTVREYKECVEKYKNSKEPMSITDRQDMLRILSGMQTADYIDWDKGKITYNSEEFIKILEFVKQYPDINDVKNDSMLTFAERLRKGDVLTAEVCMTSGIDYCTYKHMYNDDICAKGYPIEDRQGNFMELQLPVGIYSKSENKDVAWEFVSSLLTEETEYDLRVWGFPTRKDTLERLIKEWKAKKEYIDEDGNQIQPMELTIEIKGREESVKPLDDKGIEELKKILNSARKLRMDYTEITQIMNEETEAYFNDTISAKKAAENIQNRVSVYVHEKQ